MNELDNNIIKCDEISGSGLIFIKMEDPISILLMSLTGQKYSLIGFFYSSNISGHNQINIIYTDIWGLLNPFWSDPKLLSDFIRENKHINEIKIRKIKKKLAVDFKISIAEQIQPSLRPIIISKSSSDKKLDNNINNIEINNRYKYLLMTIFNYYDIKLSTSFITPIETINKMILDLSINNDHKDVNNKNINSQPSNSKCSNIKKYLIDSDLFGMIKSVYFQPFFYSKNYNFSRENIDNKKKRDFIKVLFDNFMEMMMGHELFFDHIMIKLTSNMDNTLKNIFFRDHLEKIISENFVNSSNNIINFITISLKNSTVKYNDLISLLNKYDEDKLNLLDNFRFESKIESKHDLKIESKDSKDKIIIFKNNDSYYSSLKIIRDELSSLQENINNDTQPILNINLLLENINNIISISPGKLTPIPLINSETSFQGIFVVSKNQLKKIKTIDIKNSYSEKKKIILPAHGYDLSRFKKNELIEILHTLESEEFKDGRFDQMKSDLIKLLC